MNYHVCLQEAEPKTLTVAHPAGFPIAASPLPKTTGADDPHTTEPEPLQTSVPLCPV